MKYIRTKKGKIFDKTAYKIEKLNDETFYLENDKTNFCVRVSDIVKQANTIEELCDEFVFIKGNIKLIFSPITYNKEKDIKFYDNIYGAIWTDKGLIYVAKMNEKGELELL